MRVKVKGWVLVVALPLTAAGVMMLAASELLMRQFGQVEVDDE